MKATVISARETIELDIRGNVVTMVLYEYMLDTFGPFSYKAPKSEDTAQGLKDEMARKAKLLEEVKGA
jgi:hypothetical protein